MGGMDISPEATVLFSFNAWSIRLDISADSSSTRLNGIPRTFTGDIDVGGGSELPRRIISF